ncbi:hypothetical protein V6N12_027859 [Hibiscus sabdariffa]|uniref:Uncharacterized protein n=1 Tax=Hibiscus sabdariffa TaxID=183260 RepID=A0ABR2F461_9ROSI
MIADFSEQSNTLRNPRKHRRLDDDPPDTGDPRGSSPPLPPGQSVPADSRIPSYKDKLTGGSRLPSEEEETLDEDEIEILEGDKTFDPQPNQCNDVPVESPPAPNQSSETEAFGPWMIVNRRQRQGPKKPAVVDDSPSSAPQVHTRFGPIMDEGAEFQSPEIVEPIRPPGFVTKGKSVAAKPATVSKPSKSVINVRKPLSISRNMPTSRLSNIASSSFTLPSVPRPSKPIDRGNHFVINISENADPNVVHAPMHQDKNSKSLPPGEPPDVQGIQGARDNNLSIQFEYEC